MIRMIALEVDGTLLNSGGNGDEGSCTGDPKYPGAVPAAAGTATDSSQAGIDQLRVVNCPVAMGNASGEVKAAAAMITESNDHDGLSKAIWN